FPCFSAHDLATTHISTLSLHDALPILTIVALLSSMQTAALPPSSATLRTMFRFSVDLRILYAPAMPITSSSPMPPIHASIGAIRSEEHTSELQSRENLVCRLLLEKKNK